MTNQSQNKMQNTSTDQSTIERQSKNKNHKIAKSFLSGGIAGMCSKTLIAPIERVKYLFLVYDYLSVDNLKII